MRYQKHVRRRLAAAGSGAAMFMALILAGARSRIDPQVPPPPATRMPTPTPLPRATWALSAQDIIPTQQPADLALRELVPGLDSIGSASSVQISRAWIGFSIVSHTSEAYSLGRRSSRFTGIGVVGASAYTATPGVRRVTKNVSIPLDVMQPTLQRLTDVGIIRGNYRPRIDWTDDGPEAELIVEWAGGQHLRFFSQSQGALRIPWAVEWAGTTYIVHGDAVARAIEDLEPYLLGTELQGLSNRLSVESMEYTRQRIQALERQAREATPSVLLSPLPR